MPFAVFRDLRLDLRGLGSVYLGSVYLAGCVMLFAGFTGLVRATGMAFISCRGAPHFPQASS